MNYLRKIIVFFKNSLSTFNSLSLIKKIILIYTLILIPFLYFHENHLPQNIILILISSSILVSVITLIISLYLLAFLFKKDSRSIWESFYILLLLVLLYFLGFFENNSGIILITLVCLSFLLCKLFRNIVLLRIILVGLTILVNSLLTFGYLQASELYLFYRSIQNRYAFEKNDLLDWKHDSDTRTYQNSKLGLSFQLPKGFYFHHPKDLGIKQSVGTGQNLGIISISDKDPGMYPYLRFFYIHKDYIPNEKILEKEYLSILEFLKNRGDIDELKKINESDKSFPWDGNFWSVYDNLRPRYSITGYYLLPLDSGGYLIIDIMENQSIKDFHEKGVKEILESLSLE